MIPFDFEYYRPETATDAVTLYTDLAGRGKNARYFGGGTEIISFCRLYQLYPHAVIDIKGIPELNTFEQKNGKLFIGAAKTLSQIQESNLFPLLNYCGGRVADHTIRNKITLGGNLCAMIPYRETSLALLVSEAELVIQNRKGKKILPISEIFHESLRLEDGDLLMGVHIREECLGAPFVCLKKTSDGNVGYPQDRVGYPVVSVAAMRADNKIQAAFSGVCIFPFRSRTVEEVFNKSNLPREEKIRQAVEVIPAAIHDDMISSAGYREFVLKSMMAEILERLE